MSLSGSAVLAQEVRALDLVVGARVGIHVVREAFEILSDARESRAAAKRS